MLGQLGAIGAPAVVLQLAALMFMSLGAIHHTLDAVEYFAGEQAVTISTVGNGFLAGFFFLVLHLRNPKLRNQHPWFGIQVTSAWAGNGFRVAPFEIKLTPLMDILSTEGILG